MVNRLIIFPVFYLLSYPHKHLPAPKTLKYYNEPTDISLTPNDGASFGLKIRQAKIVGPIVGS